MKGNAKQLMNAFMRSLDTMEQETHMIISQLKKVKKPKKRKKML